MAKDTGDTWASQRCYVCQWPEATFTFKLNQPDSPEPSLHPPFDVVLEIYDFAWAAAGNRKLLLTATDSQRFVTDTKPAAAVALKKSLITLTDPAGQQTAVLPLVTKCGGRDTRKMLEKVTIAFLFPFMFFATLHFSRPKRRVQKGRKKSKSQPHQLAPF